MKDLVQAKAIDAAIRKTKIFYATRVVTEAKANLQKAEFELNALKLDSLPDGSQKVDEKTRADLWCPK